jgi:hypothetical protein
LTFNSRVLLDIFFVLKLQTSEPSEKFRAKSLTVSLYTANVYRALLGVCRFFLHYLWKRAVRTTEKPYTPQRERLRMLWGNPVISTD